MRYSTDLCDNKWKIVRPLLPAAKPGGRPRSTNLREVVNAILYLVKTGCQWRNLPKEFPSWPTVNTYFKAWRRSGVVELIMNKLTMRVRRLEGKPHYPTIAIIDSQSVKTGKMANEHKGYDGGKRVKGRKRHVAVDVLGMPLAIAITAANIHDTKGGEKVIRRVKKFMGKRPLKKVYADGGYQGPTFARVVHKAVRAKVSLPHKGIGQKVKGFKPIKKRWIVERSFAWLGDYRRLDKDHERLSRNSKAMVSWAFINVMLTRLA